MQFNFSFDQTFVWAFLQPVMKETPSPLTRTMELIKYKADIPIFHIQAAQHQKVCRQNLIHSGPAKDGNV